MSGDDYKWLLPTLLVALVASIVCHARLRRYGLACLVTSGISGAALMVLYVLSAHQQITPNNAGQLIAWLPMLFIPGFLCGLCVSSFVGVAFLLARKVKRAKAG